MCDKWLKQGSLIFIEIMNIFFTYISIFLFVHEAGDLKDNDSGITKVRHDKYLVLQFSNLVD